MTEQSAEVQPEPREVAAAQLCLFGFVVLLCGFAFEEALAFGIVQELGAFNVAAVSVSTIYFIASYTRIYWTAGRFTSDATTSFAPGDV